MKCQFVESHSSEFSVRRICSILKVSRSGYYAWKRQGEGKRAKRDKELLEKIQKIFEKSKKTYGSPRIYETLKAAEERVSRDRVARIMREAGITPPIRRKFKKTTDSEHDLAVAPNLLNRNFSVPAPNCVWVSDLTFIATKEGWLYMAVIIDLFSRIVVGWAVSDSLKADIITRAYTMAVRKRNPAKGLIFHSDRGSQYASFVVQLIHDRIKALVSMSRKGNCWDNSPSKAFFSTLKLELVYGKTFLTKQEALSCIFEFIEIDYNRWRLHSTLGYKSSHQFEEDFRSLLSVQN
jgi:putative transposase